MGIDIDTLEILNATADSNSIIAKNFNTLVGEGRAMLPYEMYSDGTFEEIKALQESVGVKGKIKVQAPAGGNDDRWSAISRAMYMAEVLDKEGQGLLISSGGIAYESNVDGSVKINYLRISLIM